MFQGLGRHGGRGQAHSFHPPVLRQPIHIFCGKMSWGVAREVVQGEGGVQGDALMPLLFSLGQHGALVAVQAQLKEGERSFAFLDDMNFVGSPARVGEVYEIWRRH